MDSFSVLRLIIGLAFLSYASASDLRTRRIPDIVWIVLGALALLLLEVELVLDEVLLENHLIIFPTAVLFFGVFFGEEMVTEKGFQLRPARLGLYILSAILLIYLIYHFYTIGGESASLFWAHLSMPILIVIAHGFYQFGFLRGGADAKAFMCIALLVPIHPVIEGGFPLIQLSEPVQSGMDLTFPFAFVALLDAALLMLVLPIGLLLYNASRRDLRGFAALFGYKVSIDKIPKHVWLMDKVKDGKLVRVYFPRRREDRQKEVEELKRMDIDRVWVTPQIPFLVPMTLGFISAFIVGNFIVGLAMLIF